MNSTRHTAPSSTSNSGRTGPAMDSCQGNAFALQPLLEFGYCAARWLHNAISRLSACWMDSPGPSRARTARNRFCRVVKSSFCSRVVHSSGLRSNTKLAGSTPTTTLGLPSTLMLLPTTDGSAPNRSRQRCSVSRVTGLAPDLSSSATSTAPAAAEPPGSKKGKP